MKRIMSGLENSQSHKWGWYIPPDSHTYLWLRYSRALGIISNFITVPILTIFGQNDDKEYMIWLAVLIFWDLVYLIRCILDAYFVAFYGDNHMLVVDSKEISKRFFG